MTEPVRAGQPFRPDLAILRTTAALRRYVVLAGNVNLPEDLIHVVTLAIRRACPGYRVNVEITKIPADAPGGHL